MQLWDIPWNSKRLYSYKSFFMRYLQLTSGGEGGIRTHGAREGSTVFETARFNHSRTSPQSQ